MGLVNNIPKTTNTVSFMWVLNKLYLLLLDQNAKWLEEIFQVKKKCRYGAIQREMNIYNEKRR